MTKESTRWRKTSGVLIVALIATAFLVMTWGTVSAGEAEGTGMPDGWLLFLAGDPAASHSSVVSSPDTLRADGYSTSTLTGQVQDALNAPVEGAFVCFTTTLGTVDSGIGYVEAESTSVVTEPVSPIGWSYLSTIAGASEGQYIEANAVISPTSTVTWTFTGDAVAVRYYKAPDAGIFEVRVDSGTWEEVDPYVASGAWAEEAWSGFGAGSHTLKVRVTNRKNTSASAYFTRLDLFRTGKISGVDGTVIGTLTSALFCSPSSQTATVMATMLKDGTAISVTTVVTMVASVPTTVTVEVDAPKSMQVGANTLGATAIVTDNFGLPVLDGTMVGFTTTLPNRATVPYEYVEVEDTSQVTQVGPWTLVANTLYSGGNGLEAGSGSGPSVVWNFTGTAVSLIYRRTGTSGSGHYVDVDVDGSSTRTIDLSVGDASNEWRNEVVLFNNLSSGAHTLTVLKQSASDTVRLDALRSGTATSGGQASATVTSGTEIGWVDVYADVPYGCLSEGARGYAEGSDSLAILAGAPASAVFVGLPYGTYCGQPGPYIPATMPVTVTVSDAWSNPVANASVGFESSLVGSWPGGNPVLTGSNGEAPTQYQGSESGIGVITATVDSVVITTTLTVTPGIPYSMAMSAVPAQIYASGSHTSTITLSSEDECGNAISDGSVVTFTTDQGTFPGPVTEITGTTSGGAASTVLTSANSVVTATITGTVGTLSGTIQVPFIAGVPYTLTFVSGPLTTQCGVTDTVRIDVSDEWSNPLGGEEVTMSSTQGGTFVPNPGSTDGANGRIDFDYGGSKTTGVGTMQAIVSSNGLSQTETVTVTMGAPVSMTITGSPDSIIAAAGGLYTSTVCAQAQDACGNDLTDGTVVTLTTDLGSFSGGTTVTTTASSGQACDVLLSTDTVGTATITGTVDSLTGTGTVDFVAGPAYLLVVEPVVITTTCGAVGPYLPGYVEVKGRVRDQWNNFLPVGTLVTFSDNLGGSFSPNPAAMASDGFAYTYYTGHTAGTGVITGTHGTISGTRTVTVTAGSASQVSLTRNPIVIFANSGVSVITATVTDDCDNNVGAGIAVTFTHDSWGSLSAGTWSTDANGQASCTLTAAWPPGKVNVTATAGSGVNTAFIYFAGTAINVTLAADPTSISVGGATSDITADVRDNWSVPVVDGTQVVFETTLGTIGSTIVTKTTTYDAVLDKALAMAVLTSGIQAGTANVTAAVPVGSGSTTVEFVPGGLATFEFSLISSPKTAGTPFSITIWAKDAYGNVATNYTGPAALSDFLGSISPTVTGLFSGGSWTGSVTLTKAGTTWITAQDGLIQQSSGVFTVNPGPAHSLNLNAVPDMVPPDGVSTSTLSAVVKDQWNNDVANGTTVNFGTTLGNLSAPSATTTSGVAQVTLTSTTLGVATVSASSGSANDTDTVEFTWTVPTATPTSTGTPGPTSTPTATATAGPSPTPTATATAGPSPTPTATATTSPSPTPTETPSGTASVTGHVDLQARPVPPNSQWVTLLDIELRQASVPIYTFTSVSTDQSGDFTIGGIVPGMYDIWLKNFHSLSNLRQNVTINAGANSVDMGELQEGDASNDNLVDIDDFGILKVQFGTAGPEADFNQDGVVDIDDFGLLKVNFGESGDVIVTAMPSGKSVKLKVMPDLPKQAEGERTLILLDNASVRVSPSSGTVQVGEEFTVDVVMDPGSHGADSAQAYLRVDPNFVEILDIVDGDVPSNMAKTYDSTTGQIAYAWASFDPALTDVFTLCTIRLKAKAAISGATYIIFDCNATKLNNGGKSVLMMCYDGKVMVASATVTRAPVATIVSGRAEEDQSR